MQLTTVLLLAAALTVSAAGYSQKINLSVEKMPFSDVLSKVTAQTGYTFFYDDAVLNDAGKISLRVRDMGIHPFLEQLFKSQPFIYSIENTSVFIVKKPVVKRTETLEAIVRNPIRVRILDSLGTPLHGASITIKGSKSNGITNAEGAFNLDVNEGQVLQITFVGYQPREVKVSAEQVAAGTVTIVLAKTDYKLDELQIIAYGTTTKRLNVGNVTTITSKEIEKHPVNNVLEAIQGKVPGLFIQQQTGQPGGAFTMRMRTSANFSNAVAGAPPPLIVVDGVIYPGGTLPMSTSGNYGTMNFLQGGSGLNYLNPNDIESISVLKDADATSLFGSQGAYGVILVTTKKAKPGPATFSVNVHSGVSVLGRAPQLMNTAQYLELRREALKNDGTAVGPNDYDLNGTWPETRYNDHRKDFLGSYAQNTNADVSYSGGNRNSSFLVNASYRNNGNIQLHKGASRDGSLRAVINTNSTNNKFGLGVSATYLSSVNDMVPYDFSGGILASAPNAPAILNPDKTVNWDYSRNNIAGNINRLYRNVTNNLLASTNLVVRPAKGLSLHADFSYNSITGNEFMGYPTTTMPPTNTNAAADTRGLVNNFSVRGVTLSAYADYSNRFFGKGELSVKVGGRVDDRLNRKSEIEGQGFASDALISNPTVGTRLLATFNESVYRGIGSYAIMKMVWDNRYIVNLNGRRDGSTRFGPGRKFGNFGSVGIGWLFMEEAFLKDKIPFLSFGKLRASTGLVGGDAIGDFAYLARYAAISGTYAGNTGLTAQNLSNPILSWEKNRNSEVGLELSFLKERIFVEGNYYHNLASNQLIGTPLATVTGFGSMPVNTDAVIRTSGWEAGLNTTNIKTKNFTWTTNFNISIPRSKLVKLPSKFTLSRNYIVGKPVTGQLFYQYAGINPETGNFSFINAKGEKDDYMFGLGDEDKNQFVDMAPKYYGGFQNSFRYKQLSVDFSINYTSRLGKTILAQSGFPAGYMEMNGGTFWLNRWQQKGDITDIPKVSADLTSFFRYSIYTESDGAYTDATYARLQNVSIRYSFDGDWLRTVRVKSLQVYLQGQNLLTVSKYGALDPENLRVDVIPPMRIFTGGLNMTF